MTKTSSSSEWQCGTEPLFPGRAAPSGSRPGRSARSSRAADVRGRPRRSRSTSSTLRMFGGRSAGSPYRAAALRPRGPTGRRRAPRPTASRSGPRPSAAASRPPSDAACRRRVVEPVRAGDERVLEPVGAVDDTVAGADLVHPGRPATRARSRRARSRPPRRRRASGAGRQLPGRDADAVEPDALRAAAPEPLPGRVHLALRAPVLLDVVPVREPHGGTLGDHRCLEVVARRVGQQFRHVSSRTRCVISRCHG